MVLGRLVAVFALVVFLSSANVGTADEGAATKSTISKVKALKIARKAFLDANSGKVAKFKISEWPSNSDDGQWHFFAQGTEEYARPGYHAIIVVDKTTGRVVVEPGE